jgi:hypothetical protein
VTTAEERQQAAEIDVEGRQAKIAQMLNPSMTMIQHGPQAGQLTSQIIPDAPKPAKKTRSAPVKGLCVNCGKNFSRHKQNSSGVPEWCYADRQDSPIFSLEPAPKPTPAAPAGALTQIQVDEILRLDGSRTAARQVAEEVDTRAREAWDTFNRSEAAYFNYLNSLTQK